MHGDERAQAAPPQGTPSGSRAQSNPSWLDMIVAPATTRALSVPPIEDAPPSAQVLSELRDDRL